MTESPFAVANYFIRKAASEGRYLTPMQVIKLVYIAHGWHLGLTGRPLIDETVMAWKYGPVVESVYRTFKHYGASPIKPPYPASTVELRNPENATDLLDSVWGSYSRFSGGQLSTLTHQQGTPWYRVWHEQGGSKTPDTPIPNQLIQEHYHQKANEQRG